jgi:hypothetical protein
MFFSLRTQTNIFLRNIQQSKYANVITTLQSHVNAYICEDDDGYLPMNLCINGIATAIHTNAANHVRDVAHGLPSVRRAFGDTGYESWAPSDFFQQRGPPTVSDPGLLAPSLSCGPGSGPYLSLTRWPTL